MVKRHEEDWEAIQYFRNSIIPLVDHYGADIEKLENVVRLAERGIDLEKENEKLKYELYEKLPNKNAIEELLQGCYNYLGNDYISRDKIEKVIKEIDKQRGELINKFVCGDPKETLLYGGVYEKAVIEMLKIQKMLTDIIREE